jgi:hypothetical protein
MAVASILFVVPEANSDIASVLSENYASLEGLESTDSADDVESYLSARAGEVASVTFEDADDPLEGMLPLVSLLRAAEALHFGVTPSFEERSRGVRSEGRVFFSLGTDPVEKVFPWRDGDPELHERTLRAVGVEEEKVAAVASTFFSEVPAPRY